MTASQIIWKKPVAVASTATVAGTFTALSLGNITTTSTLTQPTSGTVNYGTFYNIPLTGGTGTGALAAITTTTGGIVTVNTIVQPSGGTITNGTYTGVALTGGSGTGAIATIVVAAGAISTVTITTAGSGYAVGNTLGYTGTGLGTGGTVTVATIKNVISSVTVTTAGIGYIVGDVLTYSSANTGTGGTITVATISTSGPGDTFTASSNATLTLDSYTPVVGDRILLKNQTAGLQNGIYNATQVNSVGLIAGTIGPIASVTNITQPTGGTITTGLYAGISLTGGSGSGAKASIQVASNQVTSVIITTPGTGYHVNDVLGFGGSGYGTGGTVTVQSTGATVQPTSGTIRNGTYQGVALTSTYSTIQGSVLSGTFTASETITQTTSGATATLWSTVIPPNGPLTITTSSITGTPDPIDIWTGNSSGAKFTPSSTPTVGQGALATVVVTGNVVTGVYITNPGSGYSVGNVLTYNANGQGFGNGGTVTVGSVTVPFTGSGAQGGLILSFSSFTQPINTFVTNGTYFNSSLTGGTGTGATGNITVSNGVVSSIVIVNPGTGYLAADVLGLPVIPGLGTGGTVTVSAITYNPWILTRSADATLALQVQGLGVFVTGGTANIGTAWVQNTLAVTLDSTALTFVELLT